jgi:hypothetical protein
MKICVLVPSEEQMAQAGVRIRYRRIEGELRPQGHELNLKAMEDLRTPQDLTEDVYIMSKCQDARGGLLARLLADNGKLVGVDLFDDYYSQSVDSRFSRLRHSLRGQLESADFILCSTPAMRELAMRLAPRLPVHVLNDPAPRLDAEGVSFTAQRKLEFAHRRGLLSVAWFGIGDNPYFPVGLTDLVAFGGELVRLRGKGFDVELSVLTNQRAMTADGMAMLKRLSVPYSVEEWNEERERLLLSRALVCFLPVNAQNFSIAKSLNRAVSALCAGSQVLSSGYPLYGSLGAFVYRDPQKLLEDLKARHMALREETVPELMRLMEQWAHPELEAQSLLNFLETQRQSKAGATTGPGRHMAAIIHGRNTVGEFHKFAQRMGALSVASPFCMANMNFDVRFALSEDLCQVLLADKHRATVGADVQASLSPHGKIVDTTYQKVDLARLLPGFSFDAITLARMGSAMSITASYPAVMAGVETVMQRIFPGASCHHAEQTPLPWTVVR